MRTFYLSFLGAIALLVFSTPVAASTEISKEEARAALIEKVVDAKGDQLKSNFEESRFGKKIAKFHKRLKSMNDDAIDLNDPVDKWMWYWLLAWAGAVALYIVGWAILWPLVYVGWLLGLVGSACFVVWILKKTGNM